jgi:hypothetical protein
MKHPRYSNNLLLIVLSLTLVLSTIATAEAHEKDQRKYYDTFTIYWENDAFGGTDRDYTNGFKMTWSTPFEIDKTKSHLPDWSYYFINKLPFVSDPETSRAFSLSIGQDTYTPEDVLRADLIVDDRPYAGYIYYATGFHNKTSNRKNSWEFQFGVVGPLSLAEENQNWSHDLIGSKRSEGWDNQLDNEITFEAIYESQWILFNSAISQSYNFDLIPHLGFRTGSITSYLNTGVEVRFGLNLPSNFGSCPIRAGCATNSAFNVVRPTHASGFRGWHLFTSIDTRAVFHDIFLDGNNFRDSHSVDKEIWVTDFMTGIVFEFPHTIVAYSYIYRTKQFKNQDDEQIFGAINVSWTF